MSARSNQDWIVLHIWVLTPDGCQSRYSTLGEMRPFLSRKVVTYCAIMHIFVDKVCIILYISFFLKYVFINSLISSLFYVKNNRKPLQSKSFHLTYRRYWVYDVIQLWYFVVTSPPPIKKCTTLKTWSRWMYVYEVQLASLIFAGCTSYAGLRRNTVTTKLTLCLHDLAPELH